MPMSLIASPNHRHDPKTPSEVDRANQTAPPFTHRCKGDVAHQNKN